MILTNIPVYFEAGGLWAASEREILLHGKQMTALYT